MFFVNKNFARRERFHIENPTKTTIVGQDYYFMSSHGISSSILYFFLYKNKMALAILPVMIADYIIWGPYYANGPMAGLAFGFIL
jgi:hypothetical protein